jgi:hypothetical protein
MGLGEANLKKKTGFRLYAAVHAYIPLSLLLMESLSESKNQPNFTGKNSKLEHQEYGMMVRASLLFEIVTNNYWCRKESDGECIPFHNFLPQLGSNK